MNKYNMFIVYDKSKLEIEAMLDEVNKKLKQRKNLLYQSFFSIETIEDLLRCKKQCEEALDSGTFALDIELKNYSAFLKLSKIYPTLRFRLWKVRRKIDNREICIRINFDANVFVLLDENLEPLSSGEYIDQGDIFKVEDGLMHCLTGPAHEGSENEYYYYGIKFLPRNYKKIMNDADQIIFESNILGKKI